MPIARPPAIGDIVEIYCSKCRLNLDASVAALVNGEVAKVMCRTCTTEVKFKSPVDMNQKKQQAIQKLIRLREKGRAGPPEVVAPPPTPVRQLWEELTDKADVRRSKVYERTRTYKVEDVILHGVHGMGIVHDRDQDGELNVLFRDGFVRLPSDQPRDEE